MVSGYESEFEERFNCNRADHRRLRFGICCLHCIYTIILSLCRAKEYSQPAERIGQCAVQSSAVQGEIQRASHPSGKCSNTNSRIERSAMELYVFVAPSPFRGLLCLLFAQDGGTLVPFSRTIPLLCVAKVLGTAIGVAECVYRWQRILLCGGRVFVQGKHKI